jgi:hypothetical protein
MHCGSLKVIPYWILKRGKAFCSRISGRVAILCISCICISCSREIKKVEEVLGYVHDFVCDFVFGVARRLFSISRLQRLDTRSIAAGSYFPDYAFVPA